MLSSLLGTIGGLSGGLGGGGGVGSGLPSTSSSSNATSTVSADATVAGIGGSNNQYGPFAIQFPGAYTTGTDSINAPTIFGLQPKWLFLGAAGVVLLVFLVLAKKG